MKYSPSAFLSFSAPSWNFTSLHCKHDLRGRKTQSCILINFVASSFSSVSANIKNSTLLSHPLSGCAFVIQCRGWRCSSRFDAILCNWCASWILQQQKRSFRWFINWTDASSCAADFDITRNGARWQIVRWIIHDWSGLWGSAAKAPTRKPLKVSNLRGKSQKMLAKRFSSADRAN